MKTVSNCENCGAQMLRYGNEFVCPACLLNSALEVSDDEVSVTFAFPRKFGSYELIEEIGRGGMGVVYRARQPSLDRTVALKLLLAGSYSSESELRRFHREAAVAAASVHPGIVAIHDFGEVDGRAFYTMDVVPGGNLAERFNGRPLQGKDAAEMVRDIAEAVQHAHARGIIHRDLKPSNVLINDQGRPLVTDFGLAKRIQMEAVLTVPGEVLGSPAYASPEQVSGREDEVGILSDVYGLGALLYHALTGRAPFHAETPAETLRLVVDSDPPAPRLINGDVPRELATVCLKCLEKEPSRRYKSAAAVAEDIGRWLRHEPILARQATWPYRARKWLRRNPATLAGVAAVVVVGATIALAATRAQVSTVPPSLAVLLRPANAASRTLTDELSRDLTHALGSVPDLSVAPRGSILRWQSLDEAPQQVGRLLRVPAILSGTVSQKDDSVSLYVELTDVKSGKQMWSRTLDENVTETDYAISRIVRTVAAQLNVGLNEKNRLDLERPLTANRIARLHFVRGQRLLESSAEQSFVDAIGEFQKAIDLDSDFVRAYLGIAKAHLQLGFQFRNPAVEFPLAQKYVQDALGRDETLPDAIIIDGVLKFFMDWDWQGSARAVQQAIVLDPSVLENHACYFHCQISWGDADEALRTVMRAVTYHPQSLMLHVEIGCVAYYAGNMDEAEAYLRETLERMPDSSYVRWHLGRVLAQQNRLDEAAATLEQAQDLPGGEGASILSELAYVRGRQGRIDDARTLVTQLLKREESEYVNPYLLAIAYLSLGETDEVFRYLELAAETHSPWFPSLPVEPKFDVLRSDPRFARLIAQLKLPH